MGMLMDLSAYSSAALQTAAGLLDAAAADGLDLDGLRGRIAARLAVIHAPVVVDRLQPPGSPRAPILCPGCGRGPLTPVANRDGLRIMGCRLCRYSEVLP